MATSQWNKAHIEERLRERFSVSRSSAPPSILVAGIGTHGGGAGVIRFFQKLGWPVTAIDGKPASAFRALKRDIGSKGVTWKFGTFDPALFISHDVIIKNPGVPMSNPSIVRALKAKRIVTNDLDIFFTITDRSRVIGITGTKGKTTTALLTKHLIAPTCTSAVVGIPGTSLFDALLAKRPLDYTIVECSSYDLELVTASPHIALLTTLAGDHISRHGTMQEYARAKANLFRFQKSSDIAFLPRVATHEKIFKNALHGRVVRFTSTPSTDIGETPWHIHPNSISAAVAIAKSLGISSAHIITRLRTFAGAPGRRERVCKSRLGVTCINDTTATAPIAAIDTICSASDTFGKAHIIAIVGGHDKELRESEIRTLASSIKRCTKHAVLLDGTFTQRLLKYLPKHTYRIHASMKSAVADAMKHAKSGDLVILTPGCASFNMFAHEFDRGDQFTASVLEY